MIGDMTILAGALVALGVAIGAVIAAVARSVMSARKIKAKGRPKEKVDSK